MGWVVVRCVALAEGDRIGAVNELCTCGGSSYPLGGTWVLFYALLVGVILAGAQLWGSGGAEEVVEG